MPELPEVEVTRRGIAPVLTHAQIMGLRWSGKALRWPMPPDLAKILAGQTIHQVDRRGKYLLLELEAGWLIVHLGMSGSLRVLAPEVAPGPWDHVDLIVRHGKNRRMLRLTDPRRFGAVVWHPKTDGPIVSHPLLAKLGIEPFDPAFDADYLHAHLRGRRSAIKTVLLSGDVVVGVGNIYASEALFGAGIHPSRAAGRLSAQRCARLVDAIRATLAQAIEQGGSTLRDFVGSDGDPGHFQLSAQVYDRADSPCRVCGTPIRGMRHGQRSTYYCPHCQH
jgi:formamidopyrimidine-DNA glycosylase